MATIIPQSELCRRAVSWISEHRVPGGPSLAKLIDEAAQRFNMSPKDVEFLERFFKDNPTGQLPTD